MPAYNESSVEIFEIPDLENQPDGIPWAIDSMTCAHYLGVRNRTITNMVANRGSMYKEHYIPKKSGGKRCIHAPKPMLKFVQKRILQRYLDKVPYPEHITAYVSGLTTREAVMKHAGKPLLIVMDLKDFFTSTRRKWIREMLKEEFGLAKTIADIISDMSTVKMKFSYGARYRVPQGAPTSGAICNWVAYNRMDKPILETCKKYGMYYTRYADDLAFSCDERLNRAETNKFIREITALVKSSGYRINRKKLRVTRSGRQQRLLGMTVNEKPNIMRLQYRRLRAQIHNCKYHGFEITAKRVGVEKGAMLRSHIEGLLAYYNMINPQKAQKLKEQYREALICQDITPPAYLQEPSPAHTGDTT